MNSWVRASAYPAPQSHPRRAYPTPASLTTTKIARKSAPLTKKSANYLILFVGAAGFEPATWSTQSSRASGCAIPGRSIIVFENQLGMRPGAYSTLSATLSTWIGSCPNPIDFTHDLAYASAPWWNSRPASRETRRCLRYTLRPGPAIGAAKPRQDEIIICGKSATPPGRRPRCRISSPCPPPLRVRREPGPLMK